MSKYNHIFTSNTFKNRLRFFILNLLLFTTLVLSIFLIVITKSNLNENYTKELHAIVKMQDQAIHKWMNERELDIRFLASNVTYDNKKNQIFLDSFITNQSEFYAISCVDKNGSTFLNTTLNLNKSFIDKVFFQDSLDGVDSISEVSFSEYDSTPVIYFSSPVFNANNQVDFVLIGIVRLSSIQKIVEDFRFSQTGETYIVNKKNQLLTKRRFEKNIKTLKLISLDTYEDGFYKSYSNVEVLRVSTTTFFSRWNIVAEISTSEMYQVFKKFVLYIFVFVTTLLIILIPLILLFSNKIEKPLSILLDHSKNIKDGNYGNTIDLETIKHSTIEILELSLSFNTMSNRLKHIIEELQISSTIDVLTQLYNRRELFHLSHKIYANAKEKKENITFLMIDIDHFKKINDTYGHRVGDIVIRHVADTIKTSTTSLDITGRYGGEEFLVLINNTSYDLAEKIAQRIRKNVENLSIKDDSQSLSCTCSIGLFYVNEINNSLTIEHSIEFADKALYEAKHTGRNKVIAVRHI